MHSNYIFKIYVNQFASIAYINLEILLKSEIKINTTKYEITVGYLRT